jgi:hypothetical protein
MPSEEPNGDVGSPLVVNNRQHGPALPKERQTLSITRVLARGKWWGRVLRCESITPWLHGGGIAVHSRVFLAARPAARHNHVGVTVSVRVPVAEAQVPGGF